ncbi:MAG: phosphoribosyltransferase [Deltaproteobacteria bacterium]|nr:phosphoribosyltransferase [Deltaproteobacteria bacterium]
MTGFPDVILHASVDRVKRHPEYAAAKAGDADSAAILIEQTTLAGSIAAIRNLSNSGDVTLVPVHAVEDAGVNAIPVALVRRLRDELGWPMATEIVQSNVVEHTGADGFGRLARQAQFRGPVVPGLHYLLVDDFVGQGGTLANMRGHLLAGGGQVVGATVLTGKLHSLHLALTDSTLAQLRAKHGKELEDWWFGRFGHTFDCLTESEARYLARTPDAERIRDRVAAEKPHGDLGSGGRDRG